MTSRPSIAAPILAVLAITLVTLGAYVGGYFLLGSTTNWSSQEIGYTDSVPPDLILVQRAYPQRWLAVIYQPAGRIEGLIRAIEVQVTYELDSFDSIPSEP